MLRDPRAAGGTWCLLPDREFKLLVARTEGWMAGVRLSAIRMEGTPEPADSWRNWRSTTGASAST